MYLGLIFHLLGCLATIGRIGPAGLLITAAIVTVDVITLRWIYGVVKPDWKIRSIDIVMFSLCLVLVGTCVGYPVVYYLSYYGNDGLVFALLNSILVLFLLPVQVLSVFTFGLKWSLSN
jgi:hypothetical protein